MIGDNISDSNSNFEGYRERLTNFSQEFEFGLFIYIVKKSMIWIVMIIGLFLFIAFLYIRYTIPIFQADTIIQLSRNNTAKKVLNVGQLYEDASLSGEVELIQSKFLIRKAINNLPLEISYFVKGDILNDEKYKTSIYSIEVVEIYDSSIIGKPIFIDFLKDQYINLEYNNYNSDHEFTVNALIKTPLLSFYIKSDYKENLFDTDFSNSYFFILNNSESLVNRFYRGVNVSILNPSAQTIKVSLSYSNARLAMDFVNELSAQYIDYDLEQKSGSSANILKFIDVQLDTVFLRLNTAESLLQSFKKEHKVTNINNISNLYVENYNKLEEELLKVELEENVLNQIQKSGKNNEEIELYNLIPFLAGTEYENLLTSMMNSMHELIMRKEEYLYTGTKENQRVAAIDYQLEIQRNLLFESIKNLKLRLVARKNAIKSKLKEFDQIFMDMPNQEMELTRLQRLYEINEKYYTMLLEKQIEYRISKAGFVTNNQILESSNYPTVPISPKPKVTYISFLIASLILSLIFIIIRYLTHNNITSINEITRLSNASLGVLGLVPKYDSDMPNSMLLVDKRPKSVLAESFRSIRSNLQFIDNSPGSKLVSITSTISGEGKTFIAINLAGIISFSNKKVIILDLDMRKPKIHKAFNCENNKGMSTLLIGKANLSDCIHHSSTENLDFITAGPVPPNPSELLLNPQLDEILNELKGKYDVIIADSPPVGLVTDGIIMLQKADFPVYVFRADYSKKQFIQNADRLKNENQFHKISVVLNSVDINRNRYGYNYGYGYGYGYGYTYGYYDDMSKKKSRIFKVKK
jgi:capsular exopolysaccharide synthesis family protein